jgi:xanthine dehydrogenase YagS FAD-binding subunit
MRPFMYRRPTELAEAVTAARDDGGGPPTMAAVQFLAGGTTILDLMKLDVMRPEALVDIGGIDPIGLRIERRPEGLYLGAFATMAQAGEHPEIHRNYPMVAQSLDLAASPQICNMATLGGNVLQRTRCTYFRDTSWDACNKRNPGSGCAALDGVNRRHAVLGTSDQCIATYPGDFAQALVALDAAVEIVGPSGPRIVPFETLHREPSDTPNIETVLQPGEVIRGFTLPQADWTRRSLYLKVRDRQSYEFALASAAVALDLKDGVVNEARIALGGVATKPWRARGAETVLTGQNLNDATVRRAAQAAFAGARVGGGNAYKRELGQRTLIRAVMQAAQMTI